jgi:hypothetical protein
VSAYPKLLVSSVVRGSQQGDSHGGLYLVDMNALSFEQVLDWNASDIAWDGRGADRGLRGIAIIGDDIFVAASDELFVFDKSFNRKASYRNAYLQHCHEISSHAGRLYLTSTGFDAILGFNLATREFDMGLRLSLHSGAVNARGFDPRKPGAMAPARTLHLNNVHVRSDGVFVSGLYLPALANLSRNGIGIVAQLPRGTHNAQPWQGGVLYNDTASDRLVWERGEAQISSPVPRHDEALLTHTNLDDSATARQAFGRGLCPLTDNIVAAGSSPTTIALHDMKKGRCLATLNLTMDVRNAAHGMAIWPF